ncbi:MAG: hypothetical protein ACLUJC_02860, partial [Clostridia bacterium]
MARFRMFVFVIIFSPFFHKMKSFVRFPVSVIMRAQKGASRPKNLRSDRACKSTMVIGAAQKSRLRNSPSLSVCLSIARIMPFHTQTVSHSANPPFVKVFLFCRVLLGIFLSVILHCFKQKSPTLFAKKGGKMQIFF